MLVRSVQVTCAIKNHDGMSMVSRAKIQNEHDNPAPCQQFTGCHNRLGYEQLRPEWPPFQAKSLPSPRAQSSLQQKRFFGVPRHMHGSGFCDRHVILGMCFLSFFTFPAWSCRVWDVIYLSFLKDSRRSANANRDPKHPKIVYYENIK